MKNMSIIFTDILNERLSVFEAEKLLEPAHKIMVQLLIVKKCCILFYVDLFDLANRADPDEMPHLAAFHLGLHCLLKYLLRSFQPTKG